MRFCRFSRSLLSAIHARVLCNHLTPVERMKFRSLLFFAVSASLVSSASAETVIKIQHIEENPDIRAIWQEAAQQYESGHPGVKVQFNYLENEGLKAKLPPLLQSKDRPSCFHSWGGGVMYEQVNSGICQDITKAAA